MLSDALAIGINEDEFWRLTPRKWGIYVEAYQKRLKAQDRQNWMLGAYITNSVAVAIEHTFGKGRAQYLEAPLSEQEEDVYIDASDWSEEEKEKYRQQLFGYLGDLQKTHEMAETKKKELLDGSGS